MLSVLEEGEEAEGHEEKKMSLLDWNLVLSGLKKSTGPLYYAYFIQYLKENAEYMRRSKLDTGEPQMQVVDEDAVMDDESPGAADLYKAYARDAQAHGRASSVEYEEEDIDTPTSKEPTTVIHEELVQENPSTQESSVTPTRGWRDRAKGWRDKVAPLHVTASEKKILDGKSDATRPNHLPPVPSSDVGQRTKRLVKRKPGSWLSLWEDFDFEDPTLGTVGLSDAVDEVHDACKEISEAIQEEPPMSPLRELFQKEEEQLSHIVEKAQASLEEKLAEEALDEIQKTPHQGEKLVGKINALGNILTPTLTPTSISSPVLPHTSICNLFFLICSSGYESIVF